MTVEIPVATDGQLTLLDLLVSRPGLDPVVRDLLWEAADFSSFDLENDRIPDPPSEDMAVRLLGGASPDAKVAALGASIDDPVLLGSLLATCGTTPFGVGAAINPHRDPVSDPHLPADQHERASARSVAKAEAQTFIAHGSGTAADIAASLIANWELSLVIAVLEGSAGELADALSEQLVVAGHDEEGLCARRLRRYVLNKASDRVRNELARRLATRDGARLEPDDLIAVDAAIAANVLAVEDVTARPGRQAAVLARLTSSPLAKEDDGEDQVPVRADRRKMSELAMQFDLFSVASGEAPAARVALSSSGVMHRDEQIDIVAHTDCEGFLDWASRSLAQKPDASMIREAVGACDRHRLADIEDEIARRPDLAESNPVLAVLLPGQTRLRLAPAGQMVAWERVVGALGADGDAWKVLVGLVPDWDYSLENLIATAIAVAHPES